MANINKELNDIKNAKYGRDVRGAIHDGIDKINKESEDSKQKANEAHDVMESILDESFDSSLLESNFEQKLDDKIGQLQPEWTQFKNDTQQNFNQVTSQLNETAKKEEVRLKSVKVEPEDWSERALALATGQGTINLLSIPQDESVTPIKTTFFDKSNNLFNKNDVTLNATIDTNGEVISDDVRWLGNEFIPVNKGDIISFSGTQSFRVALYRENKEFISRTGSTLNPNSYTVTSDFARFIKVSGVGDIESVMINKGDVLLPYEPYDPKIKNEYIDFSDNIITPTKTTFFEDGKNIFNKDTILLNTSVETDGEVVSDPLRWLSDFIPIQNGDVINFSGSSHFRIALYYEDKTFLSRTGSAEENPIKYTATSAVSKFMRISGTTEVDNLMVNKGDTLLPFEDYGSKIKSEYIPAFNSNEDIDVSDIKNEVKNELLNSLAQMNAKNPYPPTLSPALVYKGTAKPYWLSSDGVVLFGHQGSTPLMSTDEWQTRQQIGTEPLPAFINGMRELPDGELLASTNRDDANEIKAKVFKTSGFDRNNPSLATWNMVLETGASLANIQNSWGFDVYENIVVISEYGLKGENGARYAYLSTNYGETFTQIFDLVNQQVEGRPPWNDQAHVHTIAYDPYFSRIWLCTGDSNNTATYYSDDFGVTWKYVQGSDVVQFTGIIAMEDCVVFGSDRAPNGVYIYRRVDRSTIPVIEPWYIINTDTALTHIFQLPFRRDRNKSTPVYFNASSSKQSDSPDTSVVMGFVDGKKAHLIYETEAIHSITNGAGVSVALGDTIQGNIIMAVNMPDESEVSVLKATSPVWE